jgi:predicted metalloendopeptidase
MGLLALSSAIYLRRLLKYFQMKISFDFFSNFLLSFKSFQQSTRSYPKNVTDSIDCLIHQYDNYIDPETGIRNNGKQTLDGNFADLTSLKAVFASYQKYISRNGNELRLPAIKFSNEQFFWMSYAQLFCTVQRPEKRKSLNDINPHSIERFRVNGALSNIRQFSDAFKCPDNSYMNPTKKCSIF